MAEPPSHSFEMTQQQQQQQNQNNNLFLLIHTMTITESDCIVQAQFFHTFVDHNINNARLVAKRMRLKFHPGLRNSRGKVYLQRLNAPNLRNLMKRNSSNIKHHIRTVRINPQFQNSFIPGNDNKIVTVDDTRVIKNTPEPPEKKICNDNGQIQLGPGSNPEEIVLWLSQNRFEKYVETFERFSGDDMFRMSREDFIQICGDADGIRLHNAIHSKAIIPKLKIYVCRENSTVYNAIFLTSHHNTELLQKLCSLMGVNQDQVRDVYIEGPHSIHVQLSDDVLRHIGQETMFNLEVIKENNSYIFLLRRGVK